MNFPKHKKQIVRAANENDILGIYILYERHLVNRKYGVIINHDPQALMSYVDDMLHSSNIQAFVSVIPGSPDIITGVISGSMLPASFFNGAICRELSWISDPKYPSRGLALLRALEKWGKEQGATCVVAGATDEKVAKLLDLRGYLSSERTFERKI
jgi:hypothetical protein